jgi:hypothetical protein
MNSPTSNEAKLTDLTVAFESRSVRQPIDKFPEQSQRSLTQAAQSTVKPCA